MRVLVIALLLVLSSCTGGQQLIDVDASGTWRITDSDSGEYLTDWQIAHADGDVYLLDNLSDTDEDPATLVLDGSSFIIHKTYPGYEFTATGTIDGDVMTGDAVQAYDDHAEQVVFTGTRQ